MVTQSVEKWSIKALICRNKMKTHNVWVFPDLLNFMSWVFLMCNYKRSVKDMLDAFQLFSYKRSVEDTVVQF